MSTAEQSIDATDLAAVVARMVPCGRVKATYAAGAWVRAAHGAERMLSIGVVNPRDRGEAEAGMAAVGAAAAEWLAGGGWRWRAPASPSTCCARWTWRW